MKTIKIMFNGILLFILFTLITGFLYPLFITGLAQVFFSEKANGSLIKINNQIVGSLLIGQAFQDPKYFEGRPSATTPFPYNAESSNGSNFGPLNPDYIALLKQRIKKLEQENPTAQKPIPIGLLTASGSGLDPHITILSALYQVDRIAAARKLSPDAIRFLISKLTEDRSFYFFGIRKINVLKLNLALDELSEKQQGIANQP